METNFKKYLNEKQIWGKEVSPNIQKMLINLKISMKNKYFYNTTLFLVITIINYSKY